jgi:hypothetical protein
MVDAIINLGMHRSGTSCLTGCLSNYGLELGIESAYSIYNKKGNQENKEVFRLNEAVLKFNGGSWYEPPRKTLEFDDELEARRDELLTGYQSLPKPWGIKDPRMLLTYPFWENQLPAHSFIGTFRHPKAVARSLAARKHMRIPSKQAYKLWNIYNLKLLERLQTQSFPVINFDLPPEEYTENIHGLAEELALPLKSKESFFDRKLINQKQYGLKHCPAELRPTYQKLLALSQTKRWVCL